MFIFGRTTGNNKQGKNAGRWLALLLALGILWGVAGCGGGSADASGAAADDPSVAEATEKFVETDLADMTWEEILAEADGDTVTFCAWGSGGADAMVQQYWEYVRQRAAADYHIAIEYVEDTAENEQRFMSDYENGVDATIDMFWGASGPIQPMDAKGVLWGDDGSQWVKKLPNSAYLDWNAVDVLYNGTMSTNGYQAQFMKVTPAMVYAADKYDAALNWDESRTEGGATVYGLPHNLTELSLWVKKYPGKFTYLDLLGNGGFHGKQFATSALYELTGDGGGGWKAVYDETDSAAARSEKIQKNAEEWNAWAVSAAASEEAFIEKADYVWAYFNELEPDLFQGDSGAYYGADAYDMISHVNAGDIAVSFTTCISIYPKTQSDPSYLPEGQLYLMETSVGYPDFVVVSKNSKHKAAAMVLCNLLLEPEVNAEVTAVTGNAYNLDLTKLSSEDKAVFDEMMAGFPEGTTSTPERLATSAHNVSSGSVAGWIGAAWDAQVVKK
jgi:putative spermidine/putrescine transport system substrate-binding protein